MKPRPCYNEWYHKYLKIMLKRERDNPQHQYSFDRTYKRKRGELKPFYNKRNIKPKCRYSALAKKLMREVNVELRPYTNVNQRQHTNLNTVLKEFSCTINIDGVLCAISCLGSNQPILHRTASIIVLDCHDTNFKQYVDKIVYTAQKKFMTRNPVLQKEVQTINDIDFTNLNHKSEEDMFMLSTVVEHPTVLIKVQKIAEALDKKQTLLTLYTVLRELQ